MELNGFVIVLLRLQIREIPIRTFPYALYYRIVFVESQWRCCYSDLNSAKLNMIPMEIIRYRALYVLIMKIPPCRWAFHLFLAKTGHCFFDERV